MASVLGDGRHVRAVLTENDWDARNTSTVSSNEAILIGRDYSRMRVDFPFLQGTVTVEREKPFPAWCADTIKALDELGTLPENWDSYGAPRINKGSILAALDLLFVIMHDETPSPAVVPTNQGSVLLEWHTRGVDLEIEVLSSARYHVIFEDPDSDIESEHDIASDLTRLVEYIKRLSRND